MWLRLGSGVDVRWVGEGTGEHGAFQDFQEEVWTMGKTVAARWGGGSWTEQDMKI